MRITPLDIKKQPFKQTFRGYDPFQVRAFLEEIAKQDEELIRQNNEFATEIKGLRQMLEKYTSIERAMNETLMTAQKLSDDAKINAQKEAELIIKDAQVRADRYEDETRRRVNALESEVIAIRSQRDSFLARFKSMLSTQLDLLDVISGDLRIGDKQQETVQQSQPQPQPQPQPTQRMQAVAPQPKPFAPPPQSQPVKRNNAHIDDDTIDDVPPQPMILA